MHKVKPWGLKGRWKRGRLTFITFKKQSILPLREALRDVPGLTYSRCEEISVSHRNAGGLTGEGRNLGEAMSDSQYVQGIPLLGPLGRKAESWKLI